MEIIRTQTSLLAALLALALCHPAAAAAFSGWVEPAETRPIAWYLASRDGPHQITYTVSTGYCVGKSKPRIDHTSVAWHQKSAVITVYMHYPKTRFGKNEACGGVGLGMAAKLSVAHSLSERALYDGRFAPPQRRARASHSRLDRVLAWITDWL